MGPLSDENSPHGPQSDLVGHYKNILKTGQSGSRGGGNEGVGGGDGEPDLSPGGIRDHLGSAQSEIYRIIKEHLGDKPELYAIADQILEKGDGALRALRDGDEEKLRDNPELTAGLEVIVRTDGSRPSFMIRNGQTDVSTSPIGAWGATLQASDEFLHDAIACVGRIDLPGSDPGFVGTGFLIHENLIITNRHVLQGIADREEDGAWTFKQGVAIDFGHEFRGQESINRRPLRRVVFSGSKVIKTNGPIDHTNLDLALIELAEAEPDQIPETVLSIDLAPDWAQPQQTLIFAIGYPGAPTLGAYVPSLLELLFQSTFGCKRLAPGLVTKSVANVHTWTLAHDLSTLGGNSGSILLVAGRERIAAGLHYGGRFGEPRENWGHVLGRVLDETDGRLETTLHEHLKSYGVSLVDRLSSGQI